MSNVDLVNLCAALVSLVLGVLAIPLAIWFYQMSVKQYEKSDRTSTAVASSVDRLEKLFDLMYSDTTGMLKDTVADMRGYLWRTGGQRGVGTEDKIHHIADDRIETLKSELLAKVTEISERQGIADAKLQELRNELSPVLSKALDESRAADAIARERAVERDLRDVYAALGNGRPVRALELFQGARDSGGWTLADLARGLDTMHKDGTAQWDDAPTSPGPEDAITISDAAGAEPEAVW